MKKAAPEGEGTVARLLEGERLPGGEGGSMGSRALAWPARRIVRRALRLRKRRGSMGCARCGSRRCALGFGRGVGAIEVERFVERMVKSRSPEEIVRRLLEGRRS